MLEYLSIPIYQRAFWAVLLSGIMLSEMGTLMVLEQFTFAAVGTTHVAFAGVTLFILLNINPLLGAFVFALLSAFLMWYFSEHKGVSLDAGMGILFAFFMGLAILFMGLSKGYSGTALSYLFGSVLTVSPGDIYLLIVVFVLVQLFLISFHKDLFLMLLNRELAEAGGVKTKSVRLVFLLVLAIVITMTMKVLGALLVVGMAVMPSVVGLKVKRNFSRSILFSAFMGSIMGVFGFLVSLYLNTPPSATIVVLAFCIMAVMLALMRRG